MELSNVAAILASEGMSLSQKGISSAKVVLTGFVVVFAVLIFLILIIKLYSTIVSNAQKGGKKKKEKVAISAPAPTQKAVSSETKATAPAVQSGVSDEVVAVISAAVASMYGSSGKARIKSIKKSGGGRSAWANAGILDNTRPF